MLFGSLKADYYVTLSEGRTFGIPAGQTALVVFASGVTGSTITYTADGTPPASFSFGATSPASASSVTTCPSTASPMVLVGPASVTVSDTTANQSALIGMKVIETVFSSSVSVTQSGIPSNAVVIPESLSGTVSVILESSTDLITWSAASPGSYTSSTSKRFFRVRAIQNN